MLGTTMHTAFSDYAGIALFVFTAVVLLAFRWRSARLKRQTHVQPPLTDPFAIAQQSPPPTTPSQSARVPGALPKKPMIARSKLSPEARESLRRQEENEEFAFGAWVADAPAPPPQATASVPYPKAVGGVAAMPFDVTTVMRVLVTIAILAAALFIVLAQHGDAEQQKWAYGAIGTILGYWLRG